MRYNDNMTLREINTKTIFSHQMCSPVFDPDSDNSRQNESLSFLWLELTPKCNLRCVHCYVDSCQSLQIDYSMHYKDWVNALECAFMYGCKKVQFIGGEPTLYPQLPGLIRVARNIGYDNIEIFTNGTLLNNDLLDTFQKFNVNLAFSVYASQADIHDTITGQKGSFLQTIRGIRRALDYGLPLRVSIVRMQLNSEYLEDTVSFLHDLGVSTISIDDVRQAGRGKTMPEGVSPQNKFCSDCCKDKLYIDSSGDVYQCVFAQSRMG